MAAPSGAAIVSVPIVISHREAFVHVQQSSLPAFDQMLPTNRSRSVDIAELVIGYVLILAVIWTPNPAQRFLYWTAFLWIAVTSIRRWKQTKPSGLGLRGLLPSLWVAAAAAALFSLGIGLAHWAGSLHALYGPLPVLAHVGEYAIWALMQQFILQVFVLLRLLRLGMRRSMAVALSAAMFGAAHIPNPILAPAATLWAALSCILYLRYRNLYPIAVAHAFLGMCLAISIPNAINHHMRVGLGYIRYPGVHRSHLEVTAR